MRNLCAIKIITADSSVFDNAYPILHFPSLLILSVPFTRLQKKILKMCEAGILSRVLCRRAPHPKPDHIRYNAKSHNECGHKEDHGRILMNDPELGDLKKGLQISGSDAVPHDDHDQHQSEGADGRGPDIAINTKNKGGCHQSHADH